VIASFLQVTRRREWKASTMASIHREIRIRARVEDGARVVTFAGMIDQGLAAIRAHFERA
jgi:hypothetical protein